MGVVVVAMVEVVMIGVVVVVAAVMMTVVMGVKCGGDGRSDNDSCDGGDGNRWSLVGNEWKEGRDNIKIIKKAKGRTDGRKKMEGRKMEGRLMEGRKME
jgi:hypothetical protein